MKEKPMHTEATAPRRTPGVSATCHAALLGLGLAIATSGQAKAQSLDIGLNFAEVSGWATSYDTAGTLPGLRLTGDFTTGPAHGIQVDLAAEDYDTGYLGQVDLHFYLAPQGTWKYGFYASIADMNDMELTVGHAGVAAMVELAPGTVFEASAGVGLLRSPGLDTVDFVTVSGGISHAISDRTAVFAEGTVSQFEEVSIQATGYEAMAGVRHALGDGRIELTAALGTIGLTGRDSAPAETTALLGMTWRFSGGKGQRRDLSQRAFGTSQPARPLLVLARF